MKQKRGPVLVLPVYHHNSVADEYTETCVWIVPKTANIVQTKVDGELTCVSARYDITYEVIIQPKQPIVCLKKIVDTGNHIMELEEYFVSDISTYLHPRRMQAYLPVKEYISGVWYKQEVKRYEQNRKQILDCVFQYLNQGYRVLGFPTKQFLGGV